MIILFQIRQTVFSRCRRSHHDYTAPPLNAAQEHRSERNLVNGHGKEWLSVWNRRSNRQNGHADVFLRDLPGRKNSRMSQHTAYTRTTSIASTASVYSNQPPNDPLDGSALRLNSTRVSNHELKPPGHAWRRPSAGRESLSGKDICPKQNMDSYTENDSCDSVNKPIIKLTTPPQNVVCTS